MIGGASLRYGAIALWCVVAAGCVDVTNEPTERASDVAAPPVPAVVDEAASSQPASDPPVVALTGNAESPLDQLPVALESEPPPPSAPTVDTRPGATDPAVVAPPAQAPHEVEVEVAQAPSSPAVAPATVAETLDFGSLVARLRKTKAIGLLTKVSFKSESDSLLERFRAYHTQQGGATLAELRRSYDLLFQKLHSLLQDSDPPLARDIDRSQAAIWEFLSDPRKFRTSQLLAGA